MKTKLAAYIVAAASLISSPLYAQDKPCKAAVETGASAPWYNVKGPRVSLECTDDKTTVSGVYVPVSEDVPVGMDREAGHDAHFKLKFKVNDGLSITGVAEKTVGQKGGGIILEKSVGKNSSIISRGIALSGKTQYGDIKLLTKHVDIAAGVRNSGGIVTGYGYGTVNFGRNDDTFTFGRGSNGMFWQNFSAQRKRAGIFEIAYYNPKNDFSGLEVYAGVDELPGVWFSRAIDRLVASNDAFPKARTEIPAFPSYLSFGKTSGEIRMERTPDRSFINLDAGRSVQAGKVRLGAGSGIEYTNERGKKSWNPTGEVMVSAPLFGNTIMAQYRFRKNEDGLYVTASRSF